MSVITDYIASQPEAVRPPLTQMYQLLRATLPEAEERLSYGMPVFWQGKVLVYFAAGAKHLGFYPTPGPIAAFADQLAGYKTSKGAIQFPYAQPLPKDLIVAITRYRQAHPDVRTKPTPRPVAVVPPMVQAALQDAGLEVMFAARPRYQRTDYVNWITGAKREATQLKRLAQMLNELQAGDVYMKSPWHARS